MHYAVLLIVERRVTVPLPEVASVCDGGQLELNCTISGSFVEWRITPEQNHSQLSPQRIALKINQSRSVQYGDATINFTIIPHPTHLTSRTLISPTYNKYKKQLKNCKSK